MIRALFLSDIHISSPEDSKYALFLRVLDRCLQQPPEALFLVGDIFDLWVADREFFTARYGEAADRLRALVSRGVHVHYFEGNHDLDLEPFWRAQIGVEVHAGASYFRVGQLSVRVEHGDQMDPRDYGYRFLRWLLRTRFLRFLGRNLPNAFVAWLGQRASRASRGYTSHIKTASGMQSRAQLRSHAEQAFAERPFDIFVSGHVHVSEDARLENGTRIFNLGTWLEEPLLLLIDEQSVSLQPVTKFLGGLGQ